MKGEKGYTCVTMQSLREVRVKKREGRRGCQGEGDEREGIHVGGRRKIAVFMKGRKEERVSSCEERGTG